MTDTNFVYKSTNITYTWLNDVNTIVYKAASVAALRAMAYTPPWVMTRGYYAAGDGGGAIFWYDSTDTTSVDNGGSIIVSTNGARWKMLRTSELPNVKQFGAKGDGVTVDYAAIVAAYAAFSDLWWPNGTYNLGANTWTTPAAGSAIGESRRGVKLTRTGSAAIVKLGNDNFDFRMENLYFTGAGNTGIAVAGTGGSFPYYAIRLHLKYCDFAYELAYGINADLIYADISECTFGYYGTGAVPGTMVGIRSVTTGGLDTNLNNLRDLKFNNCATAIYAEGGFEWQLTCVDVSTSGIAIDIRDIRQLCIDTCWFEGNTGTDCVIKLDGGSVAPNVVVENSHFTSNAADEIFKWSSSLGVVLEVKKNFIALNANKYVLYDNATTSRVLPADGSIAFWGNNVSGGNAANKLLTSTDFRGGVVSPRLVAVINTASPGSILSSSDPALTITYTSAGNVVLSTPSFDWGTAANNVAVFAFGRTATIGKATTVSVNSVRLEFFNDAGVATDTIAHVLIYGK